MDSRIGVSAEALVQRLPSARTGLGCSPHPGWGGGSQGLGVRAPGLGPTHHPKGRAGQDLSFAAQARPADLTTPTPTPQSSFPGIWGGLFEMLRTRACIRYRWEGRLSFSPRPKGLQVLVKGTMSPEALEQENSKLHVSAECFL